MTKSQVTEHYAAKIAELSDALRQRRAKVKYYITAEIAAALLVTAMTMAVVAGYVPTVAWACVACPVIAVFIAVKRVDSANNRKISQMEARIEVYRDNVRYMNGDFSRFDDGARYASLTHQYSFDMDLFGKESLYNRICRTVTVAGSDSLAALISTAALNPLANGEARERVEERRKAVAELVQMEEWRTEFLSSTGGKTVDTEQIIKAVEEMAVASIPQTALSRKTLAMVVASMTIFAALLLITVFTPISGNFIALWTLMQLGVSIGASAKAIKIISKVAGQISQSMRTCMPLVEHISSSHFSAKLNASAVETLNAGEHGMIQEVKELNSILDALDRRANVLGLVVFNAVAWSDFFLVRRFLRWQRRNCKRMGEWLSCIGEIDARVSMATMAYNEPQTVSAEIVTGERVVFRAENLRHPFLGDKAVGNDFSVADGDFYIVTGANMAGKSTFLRAVGVNYILAMCGMPVFAASMTVSGFSLFTSMRASDNLAGGISYFNAELLRLKLLLDNVRTSQRTLIILDEILKGTNSLDKLNGSRMFLEAVSQLPVTGVIATHDLELSKMADERPDRFHNLCFEIKLAEEITYTYKITPGVARNQNATYLLRRILNDV